MRISIPIILAAVLCVVTLGNNAAAQKSELKFRVPAGWVEEERTSSMRVAQYRLPKVEGDRRMRHLSFITSDKARAVPLLRISIAG